MKPQSQLDTLIRNTTGTIGQLHPRGFGFLYFTTESGRRLQIFFHRMDSDGSAFEVGDRVSFDLGLDSQGRTRGYNVKFISAAPKTEGGAL